MGKLVVMREDTIEVFPTIGEVYYVTILIPSDLFGMKTQAAKEEYVDIWVEDHLKNVEDWKWKYDQY